MSNYFSQALLNYAYLDDQQRAKTFGKYYKLDVLKKTTPDKELELVGGSYFSTISLLSFDFYLRGLSFFKSMRTGLNRHIVKDTLIEECKRIQTLPNGGWDLEQFKILMFRVPHNLGFLVVEGTCFTHFDTFKDKAPLTFVYTGAQFVSRVKAMIDIPYIIIQKRANNVYFSVRSKAERAGDKKWRDIK